MTAQRNARAIAERLSPLAEKLGIKCEFAEDSRAVYRMPFQQDNTTVADIVHGGGILSLADCAATGAVWSVIDDADKYRGLTIDLSMSFCSAARATGLRAEARVLKRGANVCFCEVEISDDDGALVAKAKVVYKLTQIRTAQEIMTGLFAEKTTQQQMLLLAALERAMSSNS